MPSRRFRVPVGLVALAADPASGTAGDTYWNTTTQKIRVYDGTSWTDAGGSTSKAYAFFVA